MTVFVGTFLMGFGCGMIVLLVVERMMGVRW